ncbi:serine/threonine-protein kinase polo, putative [Pediculus humanus corporis]|uniref:polo kinase n=1 Tax=Pediculus humanus subsp. corporis TaxID=121224 RepID=E0VJX2_PEDHC|nr:serine/threonine-protein kinase polo, putative [Pediculus humanus corporis]EEB13678.1 serine/threonine-protein kinase polo, putative [Pediculus humanus corporis]
MDLEPGPGDIESRLGIYRVRSREVRLSQVLREVDIHGLMNHSNVVQLESYFQDRTKFYMVLEHCELNTLASLLRYRGRLEENETRKLLKQLLDGLKHIHDRGIIHRDLKPANIYLTQDYTLKIGDFGLADRIRSKNKGICGTPNYISPEVLMEQGYTTAVDVWAVGCIAYSMVCGRPPFEAETPAATYDLIRAHHYSAIPSSQAGAALRHLISWMLAFQPEDRPSIPFIQNHVWMRRNREIICSTWSRCHKKRKESMEKAPIAEISCETTMRLSENSDDEESDRDKDDVTENRKEFSFWRNLLEKAKSHTKSLTYEDVNNRPVFHHLRSRVYFAMSSKKRMPIKKGVEEVLKGNPAPKNNQISDTSEVFYPVFISKWIDYSNKYGFGYQMSDGTTGVFFNDSSQISLDGTKTCITWCRGNKKTVYPVRTVPVRLQGKVLLLSYFTDYMDNHLSSGVTEDYRIEPPSKATPLLRQWMRNDKIILFEMADGLLQINFFRDHYKMILYEENKNGKQIVLVVIDDEKKIKKYNLSTMGSSTECPEDVLSHLMYVYTLL